jgi:hypothetical protein
LATLGPTQVIPAFLNGNADLIGLYSLRNVTAGDTIDIATLSSSPNFQVIKRGVVIGVSDFVEIAATFTGTVVTIPAGMNQSSGYLLIWGC